MCIQSCSASSPTHAYTHRERDVYLHTHTHPQKHTPHAALRTCCHPTFSITTSRPLPRASQADIGLRNWTSSLQTHNCRAPAKLCLTIVRPFPILCFPDPAFGPTVAGRSARLPLSFPLSLFLSGRPCSLLFSFFSRPPQSSRERLTTEQEAKLSSHITLHDNNAPTRIAADRDSLQPRCHPADWDSQYERSLRPTECTVTVRNSTASSRGRVLSRAESSPEGRRPGGNLKKGLNRPSHPTAPTVHNGYAAPARFTEPSPFTDLASSPAYLKKDNHSRSN